MSATPRFAAAPLALAMMLLPGAVAAQEPMSRSTEALIRDATSAAPPEITRNATLMAWPEVEGREPTELRSGTNGWTCFASSPTAMGRGGVDPMCADQAGMEFLSAWMEQREPQVNQVTVMYMLQGDMGASNTDPFAERETADNEWVVAGPHLMVAVPDPTTLEGVSTDPETGGPWVMWSGTPWAHIMVPVPEGGTMQHR